MCEYNEHIRNFEKISKFHMCEQSSHIQELERSERSRMSEPEMIMEVLQ